MSNPTAFASLLHKSTTQSPTLNSTTTTTTAADINKSPSPQPPSTPTFDYWFINSPKSNTPRDILEFAPPPDKFDSELDESLSSSAADFDFNLDLLAFEQSFLFSDHQAYRNFDYPGPPSTITVSSESSTYDYDYDTYSSYSNSHPSDSFNAYPLSIQPQSPSALVIQNNHNYTLPSHTTAHVTHSLTHSPDLDLKFQDFSLDSSSLDIDSSSQPFMDPIHSSVPHPLIDAGSYYPPAPLHASIPASFIPSPTLATSPSLTNLNGGKVVAPSITQHQPPVVHPEMTTPDLLHRKPDPDPRKKYPCPSCPRSFARAFNLKTHRATHDPNRVKSHVCRHPGCGRSFSRKHDLGRHMISIHHDYTLASSSSSSTSPRGPSTVPNKVKVETKPMQKPNANVPAVSASATAAMGGGLMGVDVMPIGIGGAQESGMERVWCDRCGRGWIRGNTTRDGCGCSSGPNLHQTQRVRAQAQEIHVP